MRFLKNNVIFRLYNSYLVDSPQPANISYVWNFGSLLAVCLGLQILTGCFLAMHYVANIELAFNSVEHIMRDVENGWLIRYIHANVASFFFIFVYAHVGRNIYYGSFKTPRVLVWSIGVIILILMMAIAFLGFIKYGPKWYKYNNNYKNYNFSNLNNYKLNKFKSKSYFHCAPSGYNSINKRFYSTESINKISLVVKNFIKEKNLKPVFIYENLNNQEIKNQIKSDSNNISGIYLILNKITGDYYIGSASTNKMYSRFYRHLINLSGSKIVKLAVIKYGLANFSFIILELFPEEVSVANNKKLIDLEDFYLKSLLPNYNILTEAGSSFGYKHTEISRIKMKTNYSEKRRNTIGSLNRHNNLSYNTKLKMKEKALNRTAPRILSKEFLNNMKKNSKGIILYNLSNNTVFGEYNSILEASKCINCNDKTIRRALKTEKKILLKRWRVQYKQFF